MSQKILVQAAQGVTELIIRKGEAVAQLAAPKSIRISGTLAAPSEYLAGKEIDPKTAHLLIKRDTGSLELHINETSVESEQVITGSLSKDSVLQKFQINSEKRWSFKEFTKFIQTLAFYFDDSAVVKKMIDSLRKLEGKIQTSIKETNSNDGNSLHLLETKVNGFEFDKTFKLNIPVYQGYPKQKFTVEIGLDPKSTTVDLFLISDELFALEISLREKIIMDELAKFNEHSFSKISVS